MLKVKSKKKPTKGVQAPKTQPIQKKLVQPEWNSTSTDLDRYKLSNAEIAQKKIARISKHRYEAKELWIQRQEKLKKGIVDEETQSIMDTCLSTKRLPERNTKNLTFFVKDGDYDHREYLDSKADNEGDSDNEDLTLNDLEHHEREMNLKAKAKTKSDKNIVKEEEEQEEEERPVEEKAEEDDDFLKKVNQSLKEARDFMSKIERYPSIVKSKNPEKALMAISSLEKENRQNNVTAPKPKPQKQAPKAVNNSNLKASLGSSKGSQKQLSTSVEKKKNNSSVQSPKITTNALKPKVKEEPKEQIRAEQEHENDHEDISHYFKSLNQIEDTIKFLENNIIGIGKEDNRKTTTTNKPEESARESLNPINLEDFLGKKQETASKEFSPFRIDDTQGKFDIKDIASPQSLFNKFEDMMFTDQKERTLERESHHDHDHHYHHEPDEDHEEDADEEEQISFALTMKSTEPAERREEKYNYASNIFGLSDVDLTASKLSERNPHPHQSSPPAYPKVVFENKASEEMVQNSFQLQKKSQNQPQPQSQPKQIEEPKEQAVDEDEEDDLNIEMVKKLLQATKMDIEKMNKSHIETYNNSFKTALEGFDKDDSEIKPGQGFSYRNSAYSFEKTVGPIVKHDPIITVNQPLTSLLGSQRRIFEDIGNRNNLPDDDIPAPQTLSINRHIVAHSPQKTTTEDASLNFRSFRRK